MFYSLLVLFMLAQALSILHLLNVNSNFCIVVVGSMEELCPGT